MLFSSLEGHRLKSKCLSMHAGPTRIRFPYLSSFFFSPQILLIPYIPVLPNYLRFPECTMYFLASMSLHVLFPVPRMPCPCSCFHGNYLFIPSDPCIESSKNSQATFITSSCTPPLYLGHSSIATFIPLDRNYLYTIISSHLY